jgi:hypothetical protein
MGIVRGTDVQRKLPLAADVLGDTCRKWVCLGWWGLRTSKSAGSVKVWSCDFDPVAPSYDSFLCPLPSTEVAGTFAVVTTRLSDVLTSCVESSTSTRGNKALESEWFLEYWLCALLGLVREFSLLALPELSIHTSCPPSTQLINCSAMPAPLSI